MVITLDKMPRLLAKIPEEEQTYKGRKQNMKATNILWDTETQEELELLPKEIEIPEGMTDGEEISDYLSDKVGYCHKGFALDSNLQEEEE